MRLRWLLTSVCLLCHDHNSQHTLDSRRPVSSQLHTPTRCPPWLESQIEHQQCLLEPSRRREKENRNVISMMCRFFCMTFDETKDHSTLEPISNLRQTTTSVRNQIKRFATREREAPSYSHIRMSSRGFCLKADVVTNVCFVYRRILGVSIKCTI